jgi:hypothetical protein
MNTKKNVKTKGIAEKSIEIIKKGKQKISLDEIKDLAGEFNAMAKQGGSKYIIRGRNAKGDVSICNQHGVFYDDNDDYYTKAGYDKTIFDQFYMIQVVLVKSKK